jgi:hypothetical protein
MIENTTTSTVREPSADLDGAVTPFGKYASRHFYELPINDMAYCTWLLSQDWLDANIATTLRAAVAQYRADRAAENAEDA